MKFDINYVALLGYILLTVAYGLYVKDNLSKDKLIIFGSVLVTIGYLVSTAEKVKKVTKPKKESKIQYGHLILAIFYLISFVLPINEHLKKSDLLALVGHVLLIKHNKLSSVGMASLLVYYLVYIARNAQEFEHLPNKLQVVGGVVVTGYYGYELVETLLHNKKKSKKH